MIFTLVIKNYLMIFVVFVSLTLNHLAQSEMDARLSLTNMQRSIISISAFTAKGKLSELKSALNVGLDAGLTINEIKEVIVHLYAYCGFPRSIRGLQTFMDVIEERKSRGIYDIVGAESSDIIDENTKYEQGKINLEKLTGKPQSEFKGGYAEFAPIIEIFLKKHLFADIFQRDILTFAERELVTISVLSSIGGTEPMLKSHLSICLNLGLTPAQLNEFVGVIQSTIGEKEAKDAQTVLNEVLKNK
ncbi:MAG: carboxymuconolactone decarboxylase family protein [Ignavibacteriae bacterium]|nr:carboxymuconolactone decarboxylase family protein [Ignavibacteriota bacterium]